MENTADKKSMDKERVINVLRYAGAGLFAIGLLAPLGKTAELIIFLAAYALIGWQVLLHAAKNLVKGKVFDENFLMSIATIGAFAIGQYARRIGGNAVLSGGEAFQSLPRTAQRSISDLTRRVRTMPIWRRSRGVRWRRRSLCPAISLLSSRAKGCLWTERWRRRIRL